MMRAGRGRAGQGGAGQAGSGSSVIDGGDGGGGLAGVMVRREGRSDG